MKVAATITPRVRAQRQPAPAAMPAASSLRESHRAPRPNRSTGIRLAVHLLAHGAAGRGERCESVFVVKPQTDSTLPPNDDMNGTRHRALNKNGEGANWLWLLRAAGPSTSIGVSVSYADIYNASPLIEMAYQQGGVTPSRRTARIRGPGGVAIYRWRFHRTEQAIC